MRKGNFHLMYCFMDSKVFELNCIELNYLLSPAVDVPVAELCRLRLFDRQEHWFALVWDGFGYARFGEFFILTRALAIQPWCGGFVCFGCFSCCFWGWLVGWIDVCLLDCF